MKYRNVAEGLFVSRLNRFAAKVIIDGREETVHVKNTGRCRELLLPGARVWLEKSGNPLRKTAYDLFGIYKEGLGLVNMDSQAPNKIVGEWLRSPAASGLIPGITTVRPEYTYGRSRMDFYFERGTQRCLMEVKGVTLEREGVAYFPDAPTQRGVKHIEELERALEEGYESYLAFAIQMPGIMEIHPNDETHPAFGEALRRAQRAGVKVLALGCHMETDEIYICDGKITDRL